MATLSPGRVTHRQLERIDLVCNSREQAASDSSEQSQAEQARFTHQCPSGSISRILTPSFWQPFCIASRSSCTE